MAEASRLSLPPGPAGAEERPPERSLRLRGERGGRRAPGGPAPGPAVTTRTIGARVARNEDPRLLRGLGSFVDDVEPPGCLHAAILRGPYGHARIRRVHVHCRLSHTRRKGAWIASLARAHIRAPKLRLIRGPTPAYPQRQAERSG